VPTGRSTANGGYRTGRTGRLRRGLAADLLIVDGDPLTDPTELRDVRTVVARGRLAVTA
jgi:imidazolonepropionase-like amidohydrolase